MKVNRIVFMGSTDFSLKALAALHKSGFDLVAVYTQAPKPSGRNYKIQKTIIHQFAEEKNISVYTPQTLRTEEQGGYFKSLNPDLAIVSSYGLIIPQNILNIPTYGFINIHASLLPRWRGAAPIQSAILAGDKRTGITIMKMDSGVDTGDVISMESIDILSKTNHGVLAEEMGNLGAKMIIDVLNNLEESLSKAYKQPETGHIYANKITKESCKINWNNTAESIFQHIMAFSPTPSAWSEIDNIRIKILDAEIIEKNIVYADSLVGNLCNHMIVNCKTGSIKLTQIHSAGGNKMTGNDFIRGHSNLIGKRFA